MRAGSAGSGHMLVTVEFVRNCPTVSPRAASFHTPSSDVRGPRFSPSSLARGAGTDFHFSGFGRYAVTPHRSPSSSSSLLGLACAPTQEVPGQVCLTQGRLRTHDQGEAPPSAPPPGPGELALSACTVSHLRSSCFSQPRGDHWSLGLRPGCLWLPGGP